MMVSINFTIKLRITHWGTTTADEAHAEFHRWPLLIQLVIVLRKKTTTAKNVPGDKSLQKTENYLGVSTDHRQSHMAQPHQLSSAWHDRNKSHFSVELNCVEGVRGPLLGFGRLVNLRTDTSDVLINIWCLRSNVICDQGRTSSRQKRRQRNENTRLQDLRDVLRVDSCAFRSNRESRLMSGDSAVGGSVWTCWMFFFF